MQVSPEPSHTACDSETWADACQNCPLCSAVGSDDGRESPSEFLLLHHPNVYVRAASRTSVGMWAWRPRQIALLQRLPALSSPSGCRCPGCTAPVVLLYRRTEPGSAVSVGGGGDMLPMGAARLLDGDGGASSCSVHLVPDHPRHLEISVTIKRLGRCGGGDGGLTNPSSIASARGAALAFSGRDVPRRKRRREETAEGECYAWRLKFPCDETAILWRDALTDALRAAEERRARADDDASAENDLPPPGRRTNTAVAIGETWRWRTILALVLLACSFFTYIFITTIAGRTAHLLLKFRQFDSPETAAAFAKGANNLLEAEATVGFESEVNDESELNVQASDEKHSMSTAWTRILFQRGQFALKHASAEMNASGGYSSSANNVPPLEAPPQLHETPYRNTIDFLLDHSDLLMSAKGWLATLALIVVLIATSSLLHRAHLDARAYRTCRWGSLGVACLSFSATILHDSYVNHVSPPLRHGLYWSGWVKGLVGTALLSLGANAAKRASGWPRRRAGRRLSPARAASAGISGCVATSALPLSLRGIDALQRGQSDDARLSFAGAAFAFFTGIYFLGRAVRHITAFGGVPVGRYLLRFSLLPANICYVMLSFIEDAGRSLLVNLVDAVGYTLSLLFWLGELVARPVEQCIHFASQRLLSPGWQFLCWLMMFIYQTTSAAGKLVRLGLTPIVSVARESAQDMRRHVQSLREELTGLLRRLLGAFSLILCSTIDGIVQMLSSICVIFRWIAKAMLPLMRLLQTTLNGILKLLYLVGRLLERALSSIGEILLGLINIIISSLLRMLNFLCSRCVAPLFRLMQTVKELVFRPVMISLFRMLDFLHSQYLAPTFQLLTFFFAKIFTGFATVVTAICEPFVKRYWRLIPAVLVLNGSWIFGKATILSAQSSNATTFPVIQYFLGAWALLLIGLTLANAMLAVDGVLSRQYVDISDSIFFRHIDLHLGIAFVKLATSGCHYLSAALKIALHAIDICIRSMFDRIWGLLSWFYDNIISRIFQGVRSAISIVWDSPILSLLASISVLYGLHLHHIGTFKFNTDRWETWSASFMRVYSCAVSFSTETLGFVSKTGRLLLSSLFPRTCLAFLGDTYRPVLNIETTSPSSAFACWLFSVTTKWTCNRIRVKVFAIPALYFYLSSLTGTDLMRAFTVSFAVWVGLSLVVDQYETQQRRLAVQTLSSFLPKYRRRRRSSIADTTKPICTYQQKECCICLEVLDDSGRVSVQVALPCGHEFHRDCIRDWLHLQQRCPICCRAVQGFERVLEVLF